MADQQNIPSIEELRTAAQRAAGSPKVTVYINSEKDAPKVVAPLRALYCRLGLRDCKMNDEELVSQLKNVVTPRTLNSPGSCSIILDAAEITKQIVQPKSNFGAPDSYSSPREETLLEAFRYMMLHEGAHCRMNYSDKALSRMKSTGDSSLVLQERSKQEQSAELSAVLFVLKDAYQSNDPQKISSVRSKLLETSKYYLRIKRPMEQQFYTPLRGLIETMLEAPPEKIKKLTDAQIRNMVDLFGSGGALTF